MSASDKISAALAIITIIASLITVFFIWKTERLHR